MKRIAIAALLSFLGFARVSAAPFLQAPDIPLKDLKGVTTKIDYKSHKITLVNFWAVWCGPCRLEMPEIAKLHKEYGKDGMQAVGIAVQSGEVADVQRFLDKNREFGINYKILLGDDTALEKFGDVEIVPTTYLIDSTGKVVESYRGVHGDFYKSVSEVVKKHLASAGHTGKDAAPAPAKPAAAAPPKKPGT
ncbi:MAG TPA: TlpA disulfide reductase family protein [Candidatus Polarisedimenticolia bacterium]|nr:TlpA disulfide reductase family protein [Candidatus Polarisedimenticolia bacterium]